MIVSAANKPRIYQAAKRGRKEVLIMSKQLTTMERTRAANLKANEQTADALNKWQELDLLNKSQATIPFATRRNKLIEQRIIDPNVCAEYGYFEWAAALNAARAARLAVYAAYNDYHRSTRFAINKFIAMLIKTGDVAAAYSVLLSNQYGEAFDLIQEGVRGFIEVWIDELPENPYSRLTRAYNAAKSAANRYFIKLRRIGENEIPAGVAIPDDGDNAIVSLFDKQTFIDYARKLNIVVDPNKYNEWLIECLTTIKHFTEIEKAARAGADSIYKIAKYLTDAGYSITKSTVQRVNSKAFTLYQKYFEN